MASHIDLGNFGEGLARKYLEARGYQVLNVNWKYSYYEIDIIAAKDQVLHFIEVKTRRSKRFGLPEESVDRAKFKKLQKAAEEYLYRCPGWPRIQFDIVSISFLNNQPEYFLIEDVFL